MAKIFVILSLIMSLPGSFALAETELIGANLDFHGTVVALPCQLAAGNDNILVDFGAVSINDIYQNGRITEVPFFINLEECSEETFQTVSVVFSGVHDNELENELAVLPETQGIAVGLLDKNGQPVTLEESGSATNITSGNMSLPFFAYVEGHPSSIKEHTIGSGEFSSSATFTLIYE